MFVCARVSQMLNIIIIKCLWSVACVFEIVLALIIFLGYYLQLLAPVYNCLSVYVHSYVEGRDMELLLSHYFFFSCKVSLLSLEPTDSLDRLINELQERACLLHP